MSNRPSRGPVEVVVCVHNSPEDVDLCLGSVVRTLRDRDRLIIVDDGSDHETQKICELFAAHHEEQVRLIRRPHGTGFCKAANAGLRETSADTIVVLNSDTIVVGDWLDRIVACMSANWQIGIVGPLSNAGGWQSIPSLQSSNLTDQGVRSDRATIAAIHDYCAQFGDRFAYPLVEQINGFCYVLSRDVLSAVGLFDEERFPMGYGEESDYTLRALDAGFLCAVAIDCFVYHAKTKSYSTEARSIYNETGQEQLRALYGVKRLEAAVTLSHAHPVLAKIRAEAAEAFRENDWLERTDAAIGPEDA
ncbi:MAG: glycosyltransferase [Pseudomonadota bacterium]